MFGPVVHVTIGPAAAPASAPAPSPSTCAVHLTGGITATISGCTAVLSSVVGNIRTTTLTISAAGAIPLPGGTLVELALISSALAVSAVAGPHFGRVVTDALAAVSAVARGVQNAVVRRLAVADLTTTVLTMTLTGIAADVRSGHRGWTLVRRVLAVGAMLLGAVAGAELVLHVGATAGFGLAVALVATVAAGALSTARRPAAWRAG
jgi:uncharacterized membrane protein YoaK (UPF0700 family)